MRAIIIEDKDSLALIDQLKLQKIQDNNICTGLHPDDLADRTTVADIHRAFHYVVVKWLRDQGCSVIR